MQVDGTIVELDSETTKELRELLSTGEDPDLVGIPESMLEELQAMNRHDRRAWYAKERRRRKHEATNGK